MDLPPTQHSRVRLIPHKDVILAIDLAEYDVGGADDSDNVSQHVPLGHHLEALEREEPRRADVAPAHKKERGRSK